MGKGGKLLHHNNWAHICMFMNKNNFAPGLLPAASREKSHRGKALQLWILQERILPSDHCEESQEGGTSEIALAPLFNISLKYTLNAKYLLKLLNGWNYSQVCKAAVAAEQGQQGGQVLHGQVHQGQVHQGHQVQQVHQVQVEMKPAIAWAYFNPNVWSHSFVKTPFSRLLISTFTTSDSG